MDYLDVIRWKRWECPVCRHIVEDPNYIYVTECGNGHVCLLGHAFQSGDIVWAELDEHTYTKEEIDNLMNQKESECTQ